MCTTHRGHVSQRVIQALMVVLLLSLTFLTSACGGDPKVQQQAGQDKATLDQLTQHALSIGVPASLLHPILTQEQQISSSSAPFSLFNDLAATNFYQNQANQYHKLQVQT